MESQVNELTAGAEIASAAVFIVRPGSTLELRYAAGIAGEPLDRLVIAVRDPNHPITRTVDDATASFDVTPMAPGGPALRSHVPIFAPGTNTVVGVLAVAHDAPLGEAARARLTALAEEIAAEIG